MKYILLCFLPVWLLAKPFSVATYNVENLFDVQYQGTEYEEYTPGKHNWNARMMEIKLNHTAEVICDLNADIVGLQEVENEQILNKLIKRLDAVGCGYRYSAMTHKKGAPIQVGLLSRYKITKQDDIQVSYAPLVRNILEVEVGIDGHPLTLFVNHWKSKAYKGVESKRIHYAKALQRRIAGLRKNKEYIMLGDFNSDYNAYMTLEKKLNDTGGKTAFSDVLQTNINEEDILKAKAGEHYTLWKELPAGERWSHKFYGKQSSPDQIVLPQKLFDKQGIDYVNNSFKVFKADYLFTKRGYIKRWSYKNGKHMGKGYSDHLPVLAYFDTQPYKEDRHKTNAYVTQKKSIDYLYTVEKLAVPIKLEDVTVIFKRGRNALIKQGIFGRGVYLYGCADKLEEGHTYDLRVDSITSYNGLKEVTSAYVLNEKGSVNYKKYYFGKEELIHNKLNQNEVLSNIVGIYKSRYLYVDGHKIPIYFKKKGGIPKKGSKLKIHYAHLGYYKKLQLVVYSTKDFTVLE